MNKANRGFTLIELSIVLVIIGLIVGGVLVGRDLIKTAQLRAVITEVEKYKLAVTTFRTKYDCLPGDCTNITTFLGTTDSAGNTITNGNGNGMVDGYNSSTSTSERYAFWQHLYEAKMIVGGPFTGNTCSLCGVSDASWSTSYPGTRNVPPSNAISSGSYDFFYAGPQAGYPYFPGNYGHIFRIGAYNLGGNSYYLALISPLDAYAIDKKMDDGMPGTGIVTTYDYTYYAPLYPVACVTSDIPSTSVYANSSVIACILFFQAGF